MAGNRSYLRPEVEVFEATRGGGGGGAGGAGGGGGGGGAGGGHLAVRWSLLEGEHTSHIPFYHLMHTHTIRWRLSRGNFNLKELGRIFYKVLTLVALMIHVYDDTVGSKISQIRKMLDSSNFQKQSLKSMKCDKRRVDDVQCEPAQNHNSLIVSILSTPVPASLFHSIPSCKGSSSEKEKCSSNFKWTILRQGCD